MPDDEQIASGPSERDLLLACFEAIGALAFRLTGERLAVNVGSPVGQLGLYSSRASARWVNEVPKEDGLHTIFPAPVSSGMPEPPLAQPQHTSP